MNTPHMTPALAQIHRRALLWRIHFWAALIASPFVVVACLTGLLYVFTPQIEQLRHGHLDQVTPGERVQPLDASVAAARDAAPENWTLHSVIPAFDVRDSVRVVFVPPAVTKPTSAKLPQPSPTSAPYSRTKSTGT